MTIVEAPVELLPAAALLVGDQRIEDTSGGMHEHIYPATGKRTASIPLAGAAEMSAVVGVARTALAGWRSTPANTRRRLLLRFAALIREHAEELAMLTVIENGTPLMMASHSPEVAAELFEYNAGWTDKIGGSVEPMWPVRLPSTTHSKKPYGVIGVIIPWNGPLAPRSEWSLRSALAAGNCVVLKPPELAPWTSLRMGELFNSRPACRLA